MARIPLQVAGRSLDTGPMVQYPGSTPVADAFTRLGNSLQQVGERYKQQQDQKDAFTARVKEQEFAQRLTGLEDDATKSAKADGSGIHDTVYGQMNPDGTAAKPGSFDKLFDDYLQQVPESQRADFAAKREAFRLQGSNRLARVQYGAEQDYYKVEIAKAQNDITTAMAEGDPNDVKTFDQFKKQGLDIINKSGLPELEKEVARTNWEANADETLFKTKLAKDPSFATQARAALGLASGQSVTGDGAVGTVVNKIIGVESGGNANAKNPNSSASGLGQFIDSTWLAMIRQHRPDLAQGKSAQEILALKNDPALGRQMTEAYTRDNADYLANRGVATTAGNLYLAHFLGPAGAVQVLKADPNTPIANVVGQDVVRANGFLAGKSAADVVAWSDKKMGGSGKADPQFANIPFERRLVLANQADVQVGEMERTAAATAKADYAAHKDAIELSIVQGGITDEALILNDVRLNDGDKATLIRSLRTQNETIGQVRQDLSALAGGNLSLDPYGSKDKTRVDNMFKDASKRLDNEQMAAFSSSVIQQTGIVPQPVVNSIRKGLASTNVADVVTAAQSAQRISTFDPAALARRDGGSEVQKAADDFGFYVNKLNLAPEEAARRLIENNSPEKQRDRKAIEPAAKQFVKSLEGFDLAGEFDDSLFGLKSNPSLGLTPSQELGIRADFLAIAEDQFYAKNGDPDLAKNAAIEQMKTLYGVTEFGGTKALVKHPPEKYWPKSILGTTQSSGIFDPQAVPTLEYARKQLMDDVKQFAPDADTSQVQLVTIPETDADVKAGRLPGYGVIWKDTQGQWQTLPGKVWRPDISKATQFQQQSDQQQADDAVSNAKALQDQERQQVPYRTQTPDDFLSGNDPTFGPRDGAVKPITQEPDTAKSRLQEDRQQLFDNAKDRGLFDGGGR